MKLLHYYYSEHTSPEDVLSAIINDLSIAGHVKMIVSTEYNIDSSNIVMLFGEGNPTSEELEDYPDEARAVVLHPEMYPISDTGITRYMFRM